MNIEQGWSEFLLEDWDIESESREKSDEEEEEQKSDLASSALLI